MKKLFLTTAILSFLAMPALADMTPYSQMPAGKYINDPSHTSLTWRIDHLGLSKYTARFTDVKAELDFNPANSEQSTVKATINPLSVRTDYPNASEKDFDKELATSEQWFNGVAFPEITFVSTKIERTGENTGKIHGNLTMLGVTKPVVLDAVFNGAYANKPFADVPALGFSAKATIRRSEWGMTTYVPNIGDEVDLLIETEFHKAN